MGIDVPGGLLDLRLLQLLVKLGQVCSVGVGVLDFGRGVAVNQALHHFNQLRRAVELPVVNYVGSHQLFRNRADDLLFLLAHRADDGLDGASAHCKSFLIELIVCSDICV